MNCIEGILRDFVKCTREQTLMGNTVKVDDLAIFKVSDGDSDSDGNDLLHGFLNEKSVLEFDFQNALALFCFWGAGCDNYGKLPASCYKTDLFVSTTSGEILEKSCNGLKSVITLHRQSDKTSIFDLMIQTKYKGVIISTPECLLHQSLP